jgi:hypothetical protein
MDDGLNLIDLQVETGSVGVSRGFLGLPARALVGSRLVSLDRPPPFVGIMRHGETRGTARIVVAGGRRCLGRGHVRCRTAGERIVQHIADIDLLADDVLENGLVHDDVPPVCTVTYACQDRLVPTEMN